MGNVTILFVISGAIKVSVDGGKTSYLLEEEGTLICERGEANAATDVTMTPLLKPTSVGSSQFIQKGGLGLASTDIGNDFSVDLNCLTLYLYLDAGDATVLIIQVHLSRTLVKEPSTPVVPHLSPISTQPADQQLPPIKPSGPARSGSIIVFDDQPMWNLPPPLPPPSSARGGDADLLNSPNTPGVGTNLQTKFFESAQHYRPPIFSDRYRNESEVPPPIVRDRLVVEEFPVGTISTAWINMVKQGLSEWIRVPVIVARGVEPGPVVSFFLVIAIFDFFLCIGLCRLVLLQLCMEMN